MTCHCRFSIHNTGDSKIANFHIKILIHHQILSFQISEVVISKSNEKPMDDGWLVASTVSRVWETTNLCKKTIPRAASIAKDNFCLNVSFT